MTAPARLDPFDALDALAGPRSPKPRGMAALDALEAIDKNTAKAVFGPAGQGIGRPGEGTSTAQGSYARSGLSQVGHGLSMEVARPLASLPEFAATVVPEAGARIAGLAKGLVRGGHALPPGMANLPGAAAEAAKPSVLSVAQAASQPAVDALHRPFAPLRNLTDRVLGTPENTADRALEAVGNLVTPALALGALPRFAARRPVVEPSTAVPMGADLPQFVEPSAPQAPAAVATDVPRETTVTTPAEPAAYTGAERRTSPREGQPEPAAQPGPVGNERGMVGPLYHGSPHKFEQFDINKIGTGEGAQSYGHGLYFAENPGTARSYRNKLTGGQPTTYTRGDEVLTKPLAEYYKPGRIVRGYSGWDQVVRYTPDDPHRPGGGWSVTVRHVDKTPGGEWRPKYGPDGEPRTHWTQPDFKHMKDVLGGEGWQEVKPGALYTAELPDAEADDFLHWDRPVNQQSAKITEAVRTVFEKHGVNPDALRLNGGDILRSLKGAKPGEIEADLRKAGVVGVKYRDQGSRNTPALRESLQRMLDEATSEGDADTMRRMRDELRDLPPETHNYAVFHHDDLRILNREGAGALKYLTGLTGAGLGGTTGAASINEDDSPAVKAAKIAAGIAGGAALGYGGARMAENLGTKGAVPALVERPTLAAESNPLPPETSPEPIRPERYVSERQTEAEVIAQRAKLQQDVGPRPTGKPVEAYPSGPEDYQVQVNKIRDDPLFTKGVQEKVARLKAEGVIQPKRVVGRKLVEEQARAADLNEVMGVPRGDGLRDYHGLALRNRYADLDQLRAQADAKLAATPPTDPTYAKAGQDLQDIELQQRAVLARFVRGASQSGRDLKSLQYLASQSLDPLVWDRKAIQAMGQGSVLTSDVHAQLRTLIVAGDKKGLARYVASLAEPVPAGSLEWLVTLRKAGLLSGIRTTIRNTVGAVGRGTLDLAGKPAATGADALLSLLTGQRTTTPGDLQSWRMGAQGLRQGFAEMGDALKGNLTEAQLEKLDFGHLPRPLEGRFAQAYARTLFGWQAAIDRPNSVATYMKSLSEQAKLLAKGSEGVRADLTASPTADMIARAQIEAAYAAYQNETVLGNAATAFKRAARKGAVGIPGSVAGPLADLAVPFVKTPAAVAGAALETTPLGAIGTGIDLVRLFKAVKVGLPEPEIYALQRSAARRVGRWSTGLLATYLGYQMAAKGRLSGALPETTSERDAWRREGKQAYSYRLGDRWVPLAQLGPLAMAMGIGASWQQGDGAAAAAGSVGQQITQLPFLQGVQQIGEALGNAKSASRFAESTAGSFVPTMGSDIARAADPNLRDPENIGQGVLARIPGASRLANPALDVFGQPIPRETSTGARVASTFLDFTGSRPDRGTDDPLVADLNRLGVSLTDRRPGKGRDEAATRALIQVEGPALRTALEKIRHAGISDSSRKERYEREIRRVRSHFGRLPSEAAQ